MNKLLRNKKKRGFTLIELLGVITILGIISTIVVVTLINVMDNANEKSYKTTINNIEKVAGSYVNEYQGNLFWLGIDDDNEVYQCVTVQNLIDTGYFRSDILDSKVSDNRNVYASDNIYIGMDNDTKTINKIVFIYDDSSSYNELCSVSNIDANIDIKVPDGVKKEKEVIITYKISNRVGINSGYQYNYVYENDSSVKLDNTMFTMIKHVEKVIVKNNGVLVANVLDKDGNVVIVRKKNVTGIDNEGPVIISNNEEIVEDVVTIPINITDDGIGFDENSFELEDLNIRVDDNEISKNITLDVLGDNNYKLNIKNNDYNGNLNVSMNQDNVNDLLGNGNEYTEIFSKDIYTIKYDANGGTGAPESQVKIQGIDMNLSSGKPTRNNYKFVGWSTNKDGKIALYQSGEVYNADSGVTLYAVWEIHKVNINYNVNGGTVTSSTTGGTNMYTWTTDSSGNVYRSINGGASSLLKHTINYGGSLSSDGLPNWDNSSALNITKTGYSAKSGAEWICLSGDCTVGKTYSDSTAYVASDFCDASSGDCTVVLGVNWTINKVTINYNVNGGTVTANTTTNAGTTYSWSLDNDGTVLRNNSIYSNKINYGESLSSDGLANYNNSKYLKITKAGYVAVSGKEWICLSGCTTSGKTYDHTKVYSASDFCDASNGDCTVELGVNWGELQEYTIVLASYLSPSSVHTYYRNGNTFSTCCAYVGYVSANGDNYVVRYAFTTSSEQKANKVKIVINPAWFHDGDNSRLRFYIGTSSSSHINASGSSLYNGILVRSSVSLYTGYSDLGYITDELTGISEIDIEPNTTYYLWMFSDGTKNGYYRYDVGVFDAWVKIILNPSDD